MNQLIQMYKIPENIRKIFKSENHEKNRKIIRSWESFGFLHCDYKTDHKNHT